MSKKAAASPSSDRDCSNMIIHGAVKLFSKTLESLEVKRLFCSKFAHRWASALPCMASCHVRKVNAEDGFFDASTSACLNTVSSMVDAFDEQERTLHAMDIFAGKGNFTRVCSANGNSCEAIDVLSNPEKHDILTAVGFYHILGCVLSVVSRLNSANDLA